MRVLEIEQKQKLLFTVGISGCGKSTYTQKLAADNNAVVVNPDSIRKELTGDVSDQTQNDAVFKKAYADVDIALAAGRSVVFDSTGLYPPLRAAMIEKAKANNADAIVILFKDSEDMDNCRDRVMKAFANGEDRANTIADMNIIARQYKSYLKAIQDIQSEGWTEVISV